MTPDVPSIIYWLIGVSVVANFATIVSLLYFAGRIVWWASEITHRVKETEYEVENLREIILSRT